MRKSRLVILPTKCLHQIGFLLLFLSCPVIGDWGRIRPETEASHRAIQVAREGSCGLQRDLPGGLLSAVRDNGSDQRRQAAFANGYTNDKLTRSMLSREEPISASYRESRRVARMDRSDERRSLNRMTERSRSLERSVRSAEARRVPPAQSRSLERLYQRYDSVSLSRAVRRETNANSRYAEQRITRNVREIDNVRIANTRSEDGLSMARRQVGKSEHSIQRRQSRETPTSRSDDQHRSVMDRTSERQVVRAEESRDARRRSGAERLDRSGARTDRQQVRNGERSTARRDLDSERRVQREERRDTTARRVTESRQHRDSTRSVRHREAEREDPSTRKVRTGDQERRLAARQINAESRTTERASRMAVPARTDVRGLNDHERRIDRKNLEPDMTRKGDRTDRFVRDSSERFTLERKGSNSLEGLKKWIDYDNIKVGDWTLNCVIGAVAYYATTRQAKVA